MSKFKKLSAKVRRIYGRIRRGPGWLYLDLSRAPRRFPTVKKPFRSLTLTYPVIFAGRKTSDWGDSYLRYGVHAMTGLSLTLSDDHRAVEASVLGFGFSYMVQWDY